ncbi:hypothetical protein EDB80DRAFT_899698 [Ilyonectria destructans]|nr:hypothetical protein EDB80DRAFT_899698 [Ilyonectria destructans]
MQVTPLHEEAAEELLLMTAARPAYANTTNISESAGEAKARKQVLRELGYLPAAISVVGGILRGSFGSPQISCETYLQRCDEARDEDLEERPILSNYDSVWRAFEICFQHFLSEQTTNSRRATHLAYFVASFDDASNIKDIVQLYRQAARRVDQVKINSESTGSTVMRELRFLDHSFFRRSFDKLVSANFITGNWSKGGDDYVPYIEMHSLFKRWLQRKHTGQIDCLLHPKLWLLGFGMCRQLEQTGVETDRHSSLKSELRASMATHWEHLSGNSVPNHEAVVPFVLDAMRGLAQSIEHLPVNTEQQPGLATYSDTLQDSMRGVYDERINAIDWNTLFDEFIEQLEDQVEWAVNDTTADFQLKDFFLRTLDECGCLPIAFRIAASDELQLGGQVELIGELKNNLVLNIQSLLSACFGSEEIEEVANMCHVPHNERRSIGEKWVTRWSKDVSAIIKRGFDDAFSTVCRHGIAPGPPTPTTETSGTGLATLFAGFSTSHPRNIFFATLRRVITALTEELLIDSGAMDVLETKHTEIRDACERAIRRGLADRAAAVFYFEPLSSESDQNTAFSMLWQLAWGGRVAGGLADWVGSVVMDSISQDLQDASIEELERFLLPHCLSIAPQLAESIKRDSGARIIFLNWISSGWVDLPDDEARGGDALPGSGGLGGNIHEAFGIVRVQAADAMRAVYVGSQKASSCEAVRRALGGIFDCRRALHHDIMRRLARPGLDDRTGIGPFFAKVFLEECDKELATIYSVLTDETSLANKEELEGLQQVERNWKMQKDD